LQQLHPHGGAGDRRTTAVQHSLHVAHHLQHRRGEAQREAQPIRSGNYIGAMPMPVLTRYGTCEFDNVRYT
jgi:hypothetical protein